MYVCYAQHLGHSNAHDSTAQVNRMPIVAFAYLWHLCTAAICLQPRSMVLVCEAVERARCAAACSFTHSFLANLTCRHTYLSVADIFNQSWLNQDVSKCIAQMQCTHELLLSGITVCMSHGRSCGVIILVQNSVTPVLEHATTEV